MTDANLFRDLKSFLQAVHPAVRDIATGVVRDFKPVEEKSTFKPYYINQKNR